MSLTRSRRRVVTALVAALLAGAGTARATSPEHPASSTPTKQLLPPVPSSVPAGPSADAADRGPRGAANRGPSVAANPGPRGAANRGPSRAARAVGTPQPPTSIVIDRIKVRMPILPVGVASDGQMALPPDPAEAGWYRYGPRPGDSAGATVLAAHVDSKEYGIGPMARLGELRAGDVVTVGSAGTSRRYVVTSTSQLEKSTLDLASLFARTGPPRLHLITCGGDFDTRNQHYEQNVVVLAVPAPAG